MPADTFIFNPDTFLAGYSGDAQDATEEISLTFQEISRHYNTAPIDDRLDQIAAAIEETRGGIEDFVFSIDQLPG
ncbi:hypothetical protein [Aestuariicoccus sp. MJ-SS9]|uniref:hypothetical protein n=1 Tax=Aestuariicoccus sp. MJ-SS9 TaxID=3079855 RepID=UPI00290FB202|nr:hypothetical protein [Aestuariicoccus sp. MJ-SS9]MDU8912081.1 hypothetical protein [Aestuariicoccus sp. MJ-SS9]